MVLLSDVRATGDADQGELMLVACVRACTLPLSVLCVVAEFNTCV